MRKRLIQLLTLMVLIVGLTLGPAMATRAASLNQSGGGITTCGIDHGGSGG